MATLDQLEIVHPDGSVGFYDLEPAKGTTNIGSDPENDIVIESPEVPPFLAMIDHRLKPYQIMILDQDGNIELDGQPLQPNLGYELYGWSTVSINGHSLVLTEHGGPSAAVAEARPVAAAAAAASGPAESKPAAVLATAAAASGVFHRLTLPPADQLDEYLMAELSQRENTIECEQTASYPLTVVNGGDIVATFEVTIEGIDPAWVVIEPPSVNLNEGERASITIAITPPRVPASRAGTHHFAVLITSPNHPQRSTRLGATLNLNPFYDFAISDLSPRQLNTGWRKQSRTAATALTLLNKSNAEAVYRIDGEDERHGCAFEYQQPETGAGRSARQTEVRLPPEATTTLAVYVTPMKRRLVGLRKQSYSLTVTGTPLSGQLTPRSVLGQLQAAPLIGPWAILGIMGLLALLIVVIFRPYITDFGLTSPTDKIKGGESISLGWETSPFVQLKLLQETTTTDGAKTTQEIGSVSAPLGTSTFKLYEPVRYRLVAGNLLSSLLPFLAAQSDWVAIDVQPVPPEIKVFNSQPITIVLGQSANLFYRVLNADKLTVSGSDGLVQSITPTDTGSLSVVPPGTTKYVLDAVNRYGTAQNQIALVVVTPTPTPVPKPTVAMFDVQPRTITEGQSVKITWEVIGADSIKIIGLTGSDQLSPRGNLEQQPAPPGIDYTLIATNGPEGPAQAKVTVGPYHVKVVKAPPPPVKPVIAVFDALPKSIVRGDNSTLSWSVTGTTTDVTLSGPGLPDTGLKVLPTGSQDVYPTASALYILTAANGSMSDVKSQQVEVTEPIPAPQVQFDASATNISEGDPVNLSWEVIGDSISRRLEGEGVAGPGITVANKDPNGNQIVIPRPYSNTNFSTYTLTVKYQDSNGNVLSIVRNRLIQISRLPEPAIEYFRASCVSDDGQPQDASFCNLSPTNNSNPQPNTIEYSLWVGKKARLYWLTHNATSIVTVTLAPSGTPAPQVNVDDVESPLLPKVYMTDEIPGNRQYILTVSNAAGRETSYSLIFSPIVEPAEPPFGLDVPTQQGTYGGPELTVNIVWKYHKAALSKVIGFRILRRWTLPQPGEETIPVPVSNCTSADPNDPDVTCTYGPLVFNAPQTCGQTFRVAALYKGLNNEPLESYYTNDFGFPSCPYTGQ